WVTDFINKYLYFLTAGLGVIIYTLYSYLRTPAGKEWFDNLKVNFPSLGSVIRNLYLARLSESLSTLIKAGIPILDGLQITSELVGNENYKKIVLEAEENVRGG